MPRHRADRTVADLMVRLLLPLIALLLILPTSAQAAFTPAGAIVVNSTADTGKRCDDPTATECTLRGAINQANFNAGPDTITFNLIGPAKFTPATPLPPITQEVTIDGSGGGTVPKVEIDGSLIPEDTRPTLVATGALAEPLDKPKAKATRSSDDGVIRFLRPWGLDLRNADSSTIRGLIVHSFPYAQIGMDGTDAANIKGNWLGLKPDGSVSERKSTEDRMLGLSLINSAINVIGGPGADKNVISGNEIGLVAMDQGASANLIYGNYIGTTTDGLGRRPNTETGILLTEPTNLAGRGTEENRILGNVVVSDRDGSYGISVLAAKKTEISSNFVGVSAAGVPESPTGEPLGHDIGIYVHDSPDTVIGDTGPAGFNIVSGNVLGHRGQRRLGPHDDRGQPHRHRLLRHDRRAQHQRRRRGRRRARRGARRHGGRRRTRSPARPSTACTSPATSSAQRSPTTASAPTSTASSSWRTGSASRPVVPRAAASRRPTSPSARATSSPATAPTASQMFGPSGRRRAATGSASAPTTSRSATARPASTSRATACSSRTTPSPRTPRASSSPARPTNVHDPRTTASAPRRAASRPIDFGNSGVGRARARHRA